MRNSTDNLNALDIGAGWVIYQTLPARTWPAPPLFDESVWLLVSAPVAACRAPAWSQRAVGPVRDRGKQSLLAGVFHLEATPSCWVFSEWGKLYQIKFYYSFESGQVARRGCFFFCQPRRNERVRGHLCRRAELTLRDGGLERRPTVVEPTGGQSPGAGALEETSREEAPPQTQLEAPVRVPGDSRERNVRQGEESKGKIWETGKGFYHYRLLSLFISKNICFKIIQNNCLGALTVVRSALGHCVCSPLLSATCCLDVRALFLVGSLRTGSPVLCN